MPMAKITPLGESGLYHVHFLDARDPGFGSGRPDHPDQGLPGGGGHPGNRPPGSIGGHPDQGLPGGGGHPGNRPPGSGGGIPDNELPDHPPPQVLPGYTLVMVRGASGKWEYAAIAPGSPPPRPLPPVGGGGHPDQGLPGAGGPPHVSGQPIPGQPGHPSGQPVPPTPTPQARR